MLLKRGMMSCVKSLFVNIQNLRWYLVAYPDNDTDKLASPNMKQNNKAKGNLKMTLVTIGCLYNLGGNIRRLLRYLMSEVQHVPLGKCPSVRVPLSLLHGWGCCLSCTHSSGSHHLCQLYCGWASLEAMTEVAVCLLREWETGRAETTQILNIRQSLLLGVSCITCECTWGCLILTIGDLKAVDIESSQTKIPFSNFTSILVRHQYQMNCTYCSDGMFLKVKTSVYKPAAQGLGLELQPP